MHLLNLPLPLFRSLFISAPKYRFWKFLKLHGKGKKSKQGFEITPRNRTRHFEQRRSRTKQLCQYLLLLKSEINYNDREKRDF